MTQRSAFELRLHTLLYDQQEGVSTERVEGIEPTSLDWKSKALPLDDTRIARDGPVGVYGHGTPGVIPQYAEGPPTVSLLRSLQDEDLRSPE